MMSFFRSRGQVVQLGPGACQTTNNKNLFSVLTLLLANDCINWASCLEPSIKLRVKF